MGTDPGRCSHRKTQGRWILICAGAFTITLALAAGCLFLEFSDFHSTTGRSLYRALRSRRILVPYGFAPGTPRQVRLDAVRTLRSGVTLDLPSYSVVVPQRPTYIELGWFRSDALIPDMVVGRRIIDDVQFSPAGPSGRISKAKFVKIRMHYRAVAGDLVAVRDMGERGDRWFLVPTTAATIIIHLIRRRKIAPTFGAVSVNYLGFSLHLSQPERSNTPRGFLRTFASGAGPQPWSREILRVLWACGFSGQSAEQMIRRLVRHRTQSMTDLQLLRSALSVDGGDIKRQASTKEALWMTLLMILPSPRNGPIVWVHLRGGRTLCFANGRHAEKVWLFNSHGRAIAQGMIEYSLRDIRKWTWARRLQNLKTIAVPFFSQPLPPGFLGRNEK